jgi:lipopolysaccharide transport system permease protein
VPASSYNTTASDSTAEITLVPPVVIVSSELSGRLFLRELWHYRGLLYFLTWRDLKVRYKQTILGLAWMIIQPLAIALSLTIFLGRITQLSSDGVPYMLFVYAAMVPWQLFTYAVSAVSNSLLANEPLITKVYFPRLAVPIAVVVASLVDGLIAFVVLVPMLAYYRIVPTASILAAPLFVLLTVAIAFSVGLWLAALNVQYRDVCHTLGFLMQFWFFVSPVAYSSSAISPRWRDWYGLNPMVGAIEGFRWSVLGVGKLPVELLLVSVGVTVLIMVSALWYFRRTEALFADVI